MITCNIIGGLGNQLFQIFATISYALKHKQVFCFTDKIMTGKRSMYWSNFLNTLKLFTVLIDLKNVNIVHEFAYYSSIKCISFHLLLRSSCSSVLRFSSCSLS